MKLKGHCGFQYRSERWLLSHYMVQGQNLHLKAGAIFIQLNL